MSLGDFVEEPSLLVYAIALEDFAGELSLLA